MNEQSSTCAGCFWESSCSHTSPCEYYYSPGMEENDEVIQRFIEDERIIFCEEWYKYIKDFE